MLLLLIVLSVPKAAAAAAAAALPVLSATIGTWSGLEAAVYAADGQTVTLTLSQSFTMEGFVTIYIDTDGTAVTIEGCGATFDAAGKSSFFFMDGKVSLTVKNVTMKNVS
jgi:hypothetical protein